MKLSQYILIFFALILVFSVSRLTNFSSSTIEAEMFNSDAQKENCRLMQENIPLMNGSGTIIYSDYVEKVVNHTKKVYEMMCK